MDGVALAFAAVFDSNIVLECCPLLSANVFVLAPDAVFTKPLLSSTPLFLAFLLDDLDFDVDLDLLRYRS